LSPLQAEKTGLSSPVSFFAGLFLLALAPLIRGGNRYVPLIGLEWLGLLVLWFMATIALLRPDASVQGQYAGRLSLGEWVLILSPLWAALFFLTPLPITLWEAFPGHKLYSHALDVGWRPLSLTPDATVTSLLTGIPIVAAFVFSRTTQPTFFRFLPPALVLMAFVQAVWGLLQASAFKELYFGAEFAGGLVGSFANSNHFANFIAMTLPVAVFLLWQSLPKPRVGKRQSPSAVAVWWSIVVLVMLAAVLLSGSRTGGVTAVLVMLLTVLLLLGDMSTTSRRWYMAGAGALLLAALVIVGVNSLVARFDVGRLGNDASIRWQLAGSSWQAAVAFWPLGAGPGSFSAVYPRFQPPGLGAAVEHAHNDYVQLLMEFGGLFVALAGLAGWLIVRQVHSLRRQVCLEDYGGVNSVRLQLCCGLGLLALLLHSWVDFNLRIPANAMLSACLLGAFLRPCRSDE